MIVGLSLAFGRIPSSSAATGAALDFSLADNSQYLLFLEDI